MHPPWLILCCQIDAASDSKRAATDTHAVCCVWTSHDHLTVRHQHLRDKCRPHRYCNGFCGLPSFTQNGCVQADADEFCEALVGRGSTASSWSTRVAVSANGFSCRLINGNCNGIGWYGSDVDCSMSPADIAGIFTNPSMVSTNMCWGDTNLRQTHGPGLVIHRNDIVCSDLSLTATAPPLACYGDTTTVTVSATGGTPPYRFTDHGATPSTADVVSSTFTTFSNKAAGTYTFTVTDGSGERPPQTPHTLRHYC